MMSKRLLRSILGRRTFVWQRPNQLGFRRFVNTLTGLTAPTRLQLIAEQASKLLKHSFENEKQNRIDNEKSAITEQTNIPGFQHALDGAYQLLSVCRDPTSTLRNMIARSNDCKESQAQVRILHQAFLVTTNRCVEELQARLLDHKQTQIGLHQDTVIDDLLHVSLELAKHAHELGIPCHIPLLQRLMESYIFSKRPHGVEHILEIASYTCTPYSSALLRPALVAWVLSNQFVEAALFLEHLPDLIWDRTTCIDIYRHLHDFLRERRPREGDHLKENLPSLHYTTGIMKSIIAHLEPSVLEFPEVSLIRATNSYEDRLEEIASALDQEQEAWQRIRDLDVSHEESNVSMPSSEYSDLSDDDEDSDQETTREIDPSDLAVSFILTRSMRNEEAQVALVSVVKKWKVADNFRRRLTPEAYEDRYPSRYEFHAFPDVTSQMIALNGGADLQFSAEYEDYLMELDAGEAEYSESEDESSDNDDDYSDDDFDDYSDNDDHSDDDYSDGDDDDDDHSDDDRRK